MANRKLGRPTDQRMALLRNQVTNLIWYGKIETTLARGKEVQSLAEHLVTIAMRQCDNTVEVTKKHMNDKKQVEELTVKSVGLGKYMVVAGHRRRMAVLELIEEGARVPVKLPCSS